LSRNYHGDMRLTAMFVHLPKKIYIYNRELIIIAESEGNHAKTNPKLPVCKPKAPNFSN
jgi:hypothetical protein